MNNREPNYESIEREVSAKGYTMQDFCKMCGFDDSTWGRWKRGEMMPALRNLIKLDRGLEKLRKKKASEAA